MTWMQQWMDSILLSIVKASAAQRKPSAQVLKYVEPDRLHERTYSLYVTRTCCTESLQLGKRAYKAQLLHL